MRHTSNQDFLRYRNEGDTAALGRVFDREAPLLYRLARRLAPERVSPDDLVQATFLSAIEKAGSFQEQRSVGAWLVGILGMHVRNAARQAGRRAGTRSLEESETRDTPPAGTREPSPEERVASKEWSASLRTTIAGLPALYRPVLSAVLLEGHEPAEAAATLALRPGTARQRLRRGLSLLRAALPRGFGAAIVGLAFQRRSQAMRARVLAAARGTCGSSRVASPRVLSGGLPATLLLGVTLLAVCAALFGDALLGEERRVPRLAERAPREESRKARRAEVKPREAGRQVELPPATRSAPRRARQEAGAPETEPAEIAGRVHVLNTSHSIAGAEVAVRRWSATGTGERRVVAYTDSEGRFRFPFDRAPARGADGLGDGLPDLEISARGWASYRMPRGTVRRRGFVEAESITDRGREVFFLVSMYPTFTVSGRVVDADGLPVADAELYLLDGMGQLTREEPVGRSEYDGRFQLEDCVEYFYKQPRALPLLACAEAGVGFVLAGELQLADHTLGPGEAPPPLENIELRLQPSLEAEVLVRGPDGKALPGMRVRAAPILPEWNRYAPLSQDFELWFGELPAGFAAHFEARTDALGIARFSHLPRLDSRSAGKRNGLPLIRWCFEAAQGETRASTETTLLPRGLDDVSGQDAPLVIEFADCFVPPSSPP